MSLFLARSVIASSVPGRLRVRDNALCEPVALAALQRKVVGWRGVRTAETNPRVGSLLVHYDNTVLAQDALEARVLRAMNHLTANAAMPEIATPAAPSAPRGKKADARTGAPRVSARPVSRVAVNRQAKRAMLASLAASLALAAAGAKRWHAATGGMFLVALLAHLAVHRRHLWR